MLSRHMYLFHQYRLLRQVPSRNNSRVTNYLVDKISNVLSKQISDELINDPKFLTNIMENANKLAAEKRKLENEKRQKEKYDKVKIHQRIVRENVDKIQGKKKNIDDEYHNQAVS